MIYPVFVLAGFVIGLFAGILGIGGGVILVPFLAMIFKYYLGVQYEFMHFAAGTSLATMIFTATSSSLKNQRQKRIDWDIFKQTVPWVLTGVIVSSFVAGMLSSTVLKIFFAILIFVMAVRMLLQFFAHREEDQKNEYQQKNIPKYVSALLGSVIGMKSGLLGIGGGTISVPYMVNYKVPIKKATGTSSLFTLVIGIVGSLCFIYTGRNHHEFIPFSTGYVYWPAVLSIAPFSMISAWIGTSLAYKINRDTLRVIFIIFLFTAFIKILISFFT
ncbi:MAG: sulfite exporter TauE/SafE family protein [Candidatus Loosdrechtia sp.]|uniref:sulfite exporter TauE/SafE family protein n=1 Tax=Candidatus Loosdrechtia sp. TaxID=3101272 RepID=UPI003A73038F|nr:MAG: sulfite exporter TauE/SafE family protein [Candidatus Jettenia sp. AMX2]